MTHRKPPPDSVPLDPQALERLALAYVGRYATSRAGLRRYLKRKLVERGWAGETPPDPEGIAERFADLGYVDDRAIAEARGRAMERRGYGVRRLAGALGALGIGEADAAPALAAADEGGWETALRFAERRRIGPFARAVPDEAGRRRALAAMIRAGHPPDVARKIILSPPGTVPVRDE